MDRDTFIDEALAQARKVFEKMYDRLAAEFASEREDMQRKAAEALGLRIEASAPRAASSSRRSGKTGRPAKARAPKGAVGAALKKVFDAQEVSGFGLTTHDVEEHALHFDSAVNRKTVYNELRRKTDLYRQEGGRWYRVTRNANPPADPSNVRPNGSAGGHEAQLFGGSSARAPAAAGEVGGT